jgi:hypothetical protein
LVGNLEYGRGCVNFSLIAYAGIEKSIQNKVKFIEPHNGAFCPSLKNLITFSYV